MWGGADQFEEALSPPPSPACGIQKSDVSRTPTEFATLRSFALALFHCCVAVRAPAAFGAALAGLIIVGSREKLLKLNVGTSTVVRGCPTIGPRAVPPGAGGRVEMCLQRRAAWDEWEPLTGEGPMSSAGERSDVFRRPGRRAGRERLLLPRRRKETRTSREGESFLRLGSTSQTVRLPTM